jgi:hypothetical protein
VPYTLSVPISCDLDDAPRSIRLTVTGNWPSIAELGAIRQQLISTGLLTEKTKGLFDLRMVASVPMYSQVAEIVGAAMRQGGLPLQRAYLVGTSVQYGLVRQMQALAPPQISIEIFTHEMEALEWLSNSKA